MLRFSPLFAVVLVFAFSPSGLSQGSGEQPEGEPVFMGEPEILENETIAAPQDWNDEIPWGGDAPPWFEDPATVNCGGREACEEALQNKTAGGES